MAEKEKIILPPKYYLDYFNDLLGFIEKCSTHLLDDEDVAFIEDFRSLSEDAQCLLIRMLNRKGEYFRLAKFQYEEISNILAAAQELVDHEMISFDPPNDPALFFLFTKSELHQLFPERGYQQMYKSDIQEELVMSEPSDFDHLRATHLIIHLLVKQRVNYLKMLFFGHNHGMMTEFVIRDVGNVKLENLDNHEFTPWFDSLGEAKSAFQLYCWDREVKMAMQLLLPEEVAELVSPVNWSSFLAYPKTKKIGDKFMLRLGEYFEKSGLSEEALAYYSLAKKHPARERRIRIYEKLGEDEPARELAEVALEHPYNASEKIFAKDYLSKKSKRNYRSTTTKIKESPQIIIEDPLGHRVEAHALSHFAEQGFDGVHSENYLWRGLFGLLFWEELFDSNYASFHHPLQRMPSDLYSADFYEKRKEQLIQKTKRYRSRKKLIKRIQDIHNEKAGINNPLVGWHQSLLPSIEACVDRLPLKSIYAVMLEMAKNVKDNSTGFPDLFIWRDSTYHFYEIKSPNDHLSAQQLFWIDFLQSQNINADILRVNYSST